MNKPVGYVCSAVSDSHKTVYELLSPELQALVQSPKRGCRLHSVGRLDCDTSGLLLFTDDGYFSHDLTAPDCHVVKTYNITLKNPVSFNVQKEYSERVCAGLYLPEEEKGNAFTTKPGNLVWHDEFSCSLTISEGKFHQVRRMISVLGNEVAVLHRVKFGPYELPEDLKEGSYITFCKEEFLQP